MAVIDRIVSRVGPARRRVEPDGRRAPPDGSRVNAVIPPLAIDGPVLSIRRFGAVDHGRAARRLRRVHRRHAASCSRRA
jgi:pilus assembly protein CpaF